MPKVPTYGDPRVQSRAVSTPFSNVNPDSGLGDLAQGLRHVGQGVDRIEAAHNAARKRAADIDINNQLAGTTRDFDSAYYGAPDAAAEGESVPGSWGLDLTGKGEPAPAPLVRLQGKAAAAGSQQYFEYLDKRVQKRAEEITDDNAREEYLSRAQLLVNEYRRRAEIHVGQQIAAAETASQKALVENGMASIAGAYNDEQSVRTQSELMMDAVQRSALSKEDASAKITALHGAIGKLRVEKYLADGDVDGAERVYKTYEAHLGEDGAKIKGAIDLRRKDINAEGIAERLSQHPEITKEYGRIDVDRALEVIDEHIPASDPKLRDEVKQRLVNRATVAERKYAEDTKRIGTEAFSAFNTGGWGGIPPPLKEELNRRDPALYNRLKEESLQRWRRSRDDSAAARRDQSERNRIAYNDFMALPPDVRATTDVGQFLLGRGVDDVGKSALGPVQQHAKEIVQKGDAAGEDEFLREARSRAIGMVGKREKGDFDAAARILYANELRKLGRQPTREEALNLIGQLVQTEIEKESFLGQDWLWPDAERPGYKRIADEAKSTRPTVTRREGDTATSPAQGEPAPTAAAAQPASPAASKSRLPAGVYRDRSGRVVIVDADGHKRFE